MAQKSKVLRVQLQISDTERHCYESLSLSLAQHPSESDERLLARLLAFALEYEPGLAFGGGISSADEAPIWLRDEHGERVLHWIEIGQPDPKRMRFLSRRCPRISLYCYGPQAMRWWQQHGEGLRDLTGFSAWQLDNEALKALAPGLVAGAELQVTRSEDHLYLGLGERQQETVLARLAP
ncbi:YaeQ family protein [Motiliproteus sp. SC1-56]|uniref:YaeQ family protein n=1 Tax=Motiliproteus sp. SC1-56 TaxID=2799565 RepID=UPI001A9099E0|nr:YaeQ family protein [Motiliproteus sp. SC1-56]